MVNNDDLDKINQNNSDDIDSDNINIIDDEKTDVGEDFSVSNIFEDFEDKDSLEDEIAKKQNEIEKDLYYYLGLVSGIIKYINIFLFIIIIFLYGYISIEKSNKSSELLSPMCSVILGNKIDLDKLYSISTGGLNSCPSVTLADDIYHNSMKQESNKIYTKLLGVATDYYTMKDFVNSKEVVFLLDKSQNKKNPLNLLEQFDKIKNEFLGEDRLKIQCKDITVTDSELTASCFAFSSDWDKSKIPGYNTEQSGKNLESGTSISLASSFINYLEKKGNFILVNKQKVFKIQDVVGIPGYSHETPFTIKIIKKELNIK